MFYALPADTIFEAKERAKRATVYLFFLLVALYVFFANLLAASVFFFLSSAREVGGGDRWNWIFWTTLLSAGIAVVHFYVIRSKTLDDLLKRIQAQDAD